MRFNFEKAFDLVMYLQLARLLFLLSSDTVFHFFLFLGYPSNLLLLGTAIVSE